MSVEARTQPSFTPETTFRSYNKDQGQNYAQNRRQYHPKFYQILLNHHAATGGQFDSVLDIGCGPGTAIRSLALSFNHAVGLDPSEGMITTARSLGGAASSGEPIRFEVSTAEILGSNLSPSIANCSVDLITAAVAAHWFDMDIFWARAAEILKPGGSVAIWVSSSMKVHPGMPNSVAVQAAIDKHVDMLSEYLVHGNLLAHDLYVNLPLPWTLSTPVPEFDESTFLRKEWGTSDNSEPEDEFYAGAQAVNLDQMEGLLSTASPITRWREAHPEAVGTENDLVRLLRREIERALYEAGVEKGKELVRGGVKGVLLMVKKKA
ncbi:methyltransferase [Clohesyomyces aquaticus]|uniref:Methyltransferase n=1 Tax=Clohesyomyces aquaticus TaxID=1231657 RepID=A0A1Y1ZS01_9PLEO|nr:methyltransferase [Clohesyomyces aquaticus]